jgi:hypothetical protein
MSSFNFNSHMQALVQTQRMDQLEQEVHELREKVTTLRAEVERLINLVLLMTVTKDHPQVQQRSQQQCQMLCIQQPRQQAPRTKFDLIPMKYAELLPMLLEKNLVQTKAPPPVPKKLLVGFRADLSCVFRQGAPGHDVERCYALRNAVQDLVEAKILSFTDLNPNVQI